LEIIREVKIHNSSIQQAVLDFNMNYRALSCCYKKILNMWLLTQLWNVWQLTT